MPDQNPLDLINRRDLFMGAGMLAMLGMQEAVAGGHTAPRQEFTEEEQAALEKANADLVTGFVRDYATRSVAQHVITLILNLVTAQPFYADRVRQGEWCKSRQFSLHDQTIRELPDLQLGIVGYGVLGKAVARLARALDMNVLVAEHRGHEPRPDRLPFKDILVAADVISIHCPLMKRHEACLIAALYVP